MIFILLSSCHFQVSEVVGFPLNSQEVLKRLPINAGDGVNTGHILNDASTR